ncbi:hypothetical protein GCM10022223_68880 [Kineosporia mesophila]|uniref:Uncharacterized protein n=1 Tax=Kineosporia mesophila TaxID=566012 RepID=A0ABP7ATY8_9ACTN|nr:hypothetical protein [Kineosporia mesophila]MCD5353178.1 hypothetical protein [Kineosporia mesophila]
MALDYVLYMITDLEPEHLAHRLFPGVTPTTVDPGDIGEREVMCMCCQPVTLPHVTYDLGDEQGMSVRVEASPHRAPERRALEAATHFAGSGPENFYYLHNHHYLLLSRAHGELRRHRPKWWEWHGGFDDLVPSAVRARTYPDRPAAHAIRTRRHRG